MQEVSSPPDSPSKSQLGGSSESKSPGGSPRLARGWQRRQRGTSRLGQLRRNERDVDSADEERGVAPFSMRRTKTRASAVTTIAAAGAAASPASSGVLSPKRSRATVDISGGGGVCARCWAALPERRRRRLQQWILRPAWYITRSLLPRIAMLWNVFWVPLRLCLAPGAPRGSAPLFHGETIADALSDVAIWFFVARKYSDFRAAARERRQLLARGDSSYVQYRHRRKIAAYYALRR